METHRGLTLFPVLLAGHIASLGRIASNWRDIEPAVQGRLPRRGAPLDVATEGVVASAITPPVDRLPTGCVGPGILQVSDKIGHLFASHNIGYVNPFVRGLPRPAR